MFVIHTFIDIIVLYFSNYCLKLCNYRVISFNEYKISFIVTFCKNSILIITCGCEMKYSPMRMYLYFWNFFKVKYIFQIINYFPLYSVPIIKDIPIIK